MTRITVLADNEAGRPDCGAEHGLSCLIELDSGESWLWDTGQSDLFLRNARTLGLDVLQASGLALSHGHYDHTGGVPALLQAGFSGPVFAHPDALEQRYAVREGFAPRSIGLPRVLPPDTLQRFQTVTEPLALAPGLRMICPINRLPGMRENVRNFYWDAAGTRPDSVRDDAALLLESNGKVVVILGCCHAGLGNTLYAFRNSAGVESVDMVLGGLHLGDAGPEETRLQVEQAAAILKEFGVKNVHAGHCTGAGARELLAKRMRADSTARVLPLGAGTCLEV